ncbi:methylenetetrahydrofolate reductase [Microbacterium sp. gxy059]|uniref:methylenetetrahydrofolate reductase n=1 Tax=Microbacterium sp. gxy059 TaxID=2957199 RepID=UPI003D98B80E
MTSDTIVAPVPFSFELYPARSPERIGEVEQAATALAASDPQFISVTYGAGGSTTDRSLGLLRHLRDRTASEPVAHLTSVGATHDVLESRIDEFLDAGLRRFLALRGDPPRGNEASCADDEGVTSVELARLIRSVADRRGVVVDIAAAAYPNGHPRTGDPRDDISALLAKQAAGVTLALTQVVFDADDYARFLDQARSAGVEIPIVPGIMPIASPERLDRICGLTGETAPADQRAELAAEPDPGRRRAIAVRRAADIAEGLVAAGAPSLHLYAFNRHETVLDVLRALARRAAGVAV